MKHLLAITLLLFSACGKSPTHFRGIAMTIPYDVCIAEPLSNREVKEIDALISETFDEINQSCNHWNPTSNLSLGKSDHHIKELVRLSQKVSDLSNGKFDPYLGKLISDWKNSLENGDWLKDPTPGGSPADFDGIAKGYSVDLISKRLKENGYNCFLVTWGGESFGAGKKWKIGIPNPDHPSQILEIVEIENEAIATSGDYLQLWNVNGKIHTHIIDPETLTPREVKEGLTASQTVVAPSCAIADALATSGMFFEGDEESNWKKRVENEIPNVAFWKVTR